MLSTVYQGKAFAGLYLISGLAFLLCGFAAEFAARIKNSLVLLLFLVSVVVAVHCKQDIFSHLMHNYDASTGRWAGEYAVNESVYKIFIGYNVVMAILSFVMIPPSFIHELASR